MITKSGQRVSLCSLTKKPQAPGMRPWAENKPEIGEKFPPLDCLTEAELWLEGETGREDTTNTALIPFFEF